MDLYNLELVFRLSLFWVLGLLLLWGVVLPVFSVFLGGLPGLQVFLFLLVLVGLGSAVCMFAGVLYRSTWFVVFVSSFVF